MNEELRLKYGYPVKCDLCNTLPDKPKDVSRVDPYHKTGKKLRLMLIGQDPTIYKDAERVTTVLMLNEAKGRNGQLRKWLEKELFGIDNFQNIEIYATNLIKCQFDNPPAKSAKGALNFLRPRFKYCKDYLYKEIQTFNPEIVLTLGEPTHKLFTREFGIKFEGLIGTMKDDFNGHFYKSRINGTEFLYSPCLHITTYRVAETYGKSVLDFKNVLAEKLG